MTIKGVDIIMLSKKVFITAVSTLSAATIVALSVAAVNLKILPVATVASDTSSSESSYTSSGTSSTPSSTPAVSSAVSSAVSQIVSEPPVSTVTPSVSSSTVSVAVPPPVSTVTPSVSSSTVSVAVPPPVVVAPVIITPKIIEAKVYNMNYSVTARGATITFNKCTTGPNSFYFECSFQSEKTFNFSTDGMVLKTIDGTIIPLKFDVGKFRSALGPYASRDWMSANYSGASDITKLYFTYDFKNYSFDPVDDTTSPQTVEIDLQ
jgi:hypothetical protein